MTTMKLLEQKQKLIKDIKTKEDELALLSYQLENKESEILLTTNFRELGYTNEDTRKAYVNNHLSELKKARVLKKNEINLLKRELEIVCDKIKLFSF